MTDQVDQEVEAIKAVLTALSPLSEKARASVLDYVVKRLDLPPLLGTTAGGSGGQRSADNAVPQHDAGTGAPQHIKDLKVLKLPRSANEMAAVVAYYLANLAPIADRKKTINQRDAETYFKIAEFPLPKQPRVLLPNAKAAGYFDSAGEGEYKLNAVGHNLVAHAMPRGGEAKATKRTAKRKKPSAPRLPPRKKAR